MTFNIITKYNHTLALVIFLLLSLSSPGQNELKELKQKQKMQKKLDKIYKDKIQSFEKAGYSVYASTKTLGEVLYEHDKKIESGRYEPQIFVDQRNCHSANSCNRKSFNDAATSYATRTNAFVRGKITRELSEANVGIGKNRIEEVIDKFSEIFKTEVSANVSDQLDLSYALVSEKKGKVHMQQYFLVLKEDGRKARRQSFNEALEKYEQSQAASEANVQWMQSNSDFIEEVPSEETSNNVQDPGTLGEGYSSYQRRLNENYEAWSKQQNWKNNYFEWKKQSDAEYEKWKQASGIGNDFDTDWNDLFVDEATQVNDKADSLIKVINDIRKNSAESDATSQARISALQTQIQIIAKEQEIMESLGNYKVWAVIVGVSHYRQSQIRLNYCDDDAYRLYAFLQSPEGGAVPNDQIRLFVDEEAKGESIKLTVKEFVQKAGPNDVFLFYFSGHGTVTNLLAEDYGINVNGEISHRFLSNQIRASKAKLNLCMIDACHSGSLAMRVEAENKILEKKYAVVEGEPPVGYRSIASLESTTQFYQALQDSPKGSVFFLSSKGEETSLEVRGKRQGVFSHFFIQGLKGEADYNNDRVVSVTESFDYTSKKVKEYTNNKQTPVITGQYSHRQPLAVVRKQSGS